MKTNSNSLLILLMRKPIHCLTLLLAISTLFLGCAKQLWMQEVTLTRQEVSEYLQHNGYTLKLKGTKCVLSKGSHKLVVRRLERPDAPLDDIGNLPRVWNSAGYLKIDEVIIARYDSSHLIVYIKQYGTGLIGISENTKKHK